MSIGAPILDEVAEAAAYATEQRVAWEAESASRRYDAQQQEAAQLMAMAQRARQQAQVAKQSNVQALIDRIEQLQEEANSLLEQIGEAEQAHLIAEHVRIYEGLPNWESPKEKLLPYLYGDLQDVRNEQDRLRRELDRLAEEERARRQQSEEAQH